MTRIEKLKNMTSKEIADELCDNYNYDNNSLCPFCVYREYNCNDKDCSIGIEKWLESEAKTEADMMLEELGYKIDHIAKDVLKLEFIGYVNSKETKNGKEKGIKILKKDGKWLYSVFWYSKIENQTNDHDIAYISEEENKAIQKKLEELKNGNI